MDHGSKFYVMSCGRTLPGFDVDDVGARVAAICGVSETGAHSIITRQRVLKKNLDYECAIKYQRTFEEMGVEIRLLELHPSTTESQAHPESSEDTSTECSEDRHEHQAAYDSGAAVRKRSGSQGGLVKTLRKLPDFPLFNEAKRSVPTPEEPEETTLAPQVTDIRVEQASRSLKPWHEFARQVIDARKSKSGAKLYEKIAEDFEEEELAAIGHLMLFVTGFVSTISAGSRGLLHDLSERFYEKQPYPQTACRNTKH